MRVIANVNDEPQELPVDVLQSRGLFDQLAMRNLITGQEHRAEEGVLTLPPISLHWLVEAGV